MRGKLLQRADRRLDEERRDAEADAVALLERLLVTLAQRHHGGHVDLVEGRQHRRGALRLDEPPGDRRAPLRHPHALFGAIAVGTAAVFGNRRHRLRLVGLRSERRNARAVGRFHRGASGFLGGASGFLNVAAHHAPAVAAAAHAETDRPRSPRQPSARSASLAAVRAGSPCCAWPPAVGATRPRRRASPRPSLTRRGSPGLRRP